MLNFRILQTAVWVALLFAVEFIVSLPPNCQDLVSPTGDDTWLKCSWRNPECILQDQTDPANPQRVWARAQMHIGWHRFNIQNCI